MEAERNILKNDFAQHMAEAATRLEAERKKNDDAEQKLTLLEN
jgi:hypothetical protein